MRGKKNIMYYNVLNIISCISVIAMHVNSASWTFERTWMWGEALLAEVICYFAVPVFFMLSGATLMDYRSRYSTKIFFFKRIKRILIPFCVWSLIYLIFNRVIGSIEEITPKAIIEALTAYSSQSVFWFIHAILNVYLCMPFLSLIAEERWYNLRWYLIALAFITRILFPMITQLTGISFGTNSSLYVMDGYLLYVVLGYQLSQINLHNKWVYFSVIMGAFACIIRYLGTIVCSMRDGTLSTAFYGYLTVWALFPACAIFILAKSLEKKFELLSYETRDKIKKISSLSLGIYFIHKLVIAVVVKTLRLNMHALFYPIIGPIVVYLASCLIVSALKKLPFVKHVVP